MCDQQTFQFFAELRDTEIEPNIWRRFQVDSHATFADLAYVVMTLFEMRGEHLFAFRLPETEIDGSKADHIYIKEMLEVRKPFTMLYDFGDSWEVQLCMESKEIGDGTAPKVLNGEGYGIIENCGGAPTLSRYTGLFQLTLSHLTSRNISSSSELIRRNSILLGLIWTT